MDTTWTMVTPVSVCVGVEVPVGVGVTVGVPVGVEVGVVDGVTVGVDVGVVDGVPVGVDVGVVVGVLVGVEVGVLVGVPVGVPVGVDVGVVVGVPVGVEVGVLVGVLVGVPVGVDVGVGMGVMRQVGVGSETATRTPDSIGAAGACAAAVGAVASEPTRAKAAARLQIEVVARACGRRLVCMRTRLTPCRVLRKRKSHFLHPSLSVPSSNASRSHTGSWIPPVIRR
ncbi:hypothetical protein NNX39_13860 [Arthrobacter sp. zg-Y826]|uniref:hypothetical protein n=1 Tax=Arthrobacter jinronghuae TaxID=2964609 RepID=UPI0021052F25|nr:hypothetical protein [Arthrobacter jinronghuae]MCQ1957580.1 hypothetical protein [Arthrobacter jinronghuae]